ncbi:hypothetical protein GFS31_38100 [Leptolyngbya sp. BL0902]|uniref:outer membrane protein n=1 Tax=Leptolyngbya sp. BL0902 TaxID=1115757 RepID=UPI0018E8A5B1|nr:hypothetical protein [Leptolyngbya sp. BL0902]QQE67103.1 hypothetical protein GFS31_38100 [Leptolyngbya sp. BL0902]
MVLNVLKLSVAGAGALLVAAWPTLAQAGGSQDVVEASNREDVAPLGMPRVEHREPEYAGMVAQDPVSVDPEVASDELAGEDLALEDLGLSGLAFEAGATTGMAQDLMPLMPGLIAAESVVETVPAPNQVAQVRPSTDGEEWEYVLSPYLFVPFSVRSELTIGGVTRSVSAGLGDLFSLDRIFSGALRFEARQPKYGFFADASHVFVREGQGVTGFPLPPAVAGVIAAQAGVPIPPGTPLDANITGTGRTTTVSLGGYYRVVDQVLGAGTASASNYPRLMVDPYLGARLVALNSSLDFDVAIAGANRTARLSDSTVLFKPMIGTQVGLELSDQWALGLRGDLSGLAIGADDSFAWSLWAGARYRFSPSWALQLGYQYKDSNYRLGQGATRFSIDQTQQGIWTGLDIRL